ncbi:DUF4280 domain-containing protein, partial [Salmonella enterica]|nr:DUF4280 domain-containing protein [Salmonella enterica]
MSRSFVRQGVNIICSNMTSPTPKKLGLNPAKESVEGAGITIYSMIPEPLLNIQDKKLDACFECKMPRKKWDGLAAFFAGVAVVAVVAVIVITAPVSGPIIAAIAASTAATAAATVAVAATAGVAIAEYVCYRTSHDCDIISKANWENYHKTVFIEGKNALLDSSFMKCPVGGRLEIIIDDDLALNTAKIISLANNDEIFWNETNKFINGIIAFSAGGPFGAIIASALEVYNTVTDDGKDKGIAGDSADATIDAGISFGADTIKKKIVSNSYRWADFIADFKNGVSGALGGFFLDLCFKSLEENDANYAKESLERNDDSDENNLQTSKNFIK